MILLITAGILATPFLLVGGVVALFRKGRRLRVWKWTGALYAAALLLFFFGVAPYLMAGFLADSGSRPMDLNLPETPADWNLPYREIAFPAADGVQLSGWLIEPQQGRALILYSHGLFRSRHEVLERAMKLSQLGYGALLYDARHHGRSGKGIVSLGFYERQDVQGALEYARSQPGIGQGRFVLMGVSMGAAAVLMAAAGSTGYDAIVADSPFLNFEQTIARHAWLFLNMPRFPFVPIFLKFYQDRAGFHRSQFDVHAAAARVQPVPVLMIHGGADDRIPVSDGRLIYEALASRQKDFVVIEGATHGAAYRTAPAQYVERVTKFLAQALP